MPNQHAELLQRITHCRPHNQPLIVYPAHQPPNHSITYNLDTKKEFRVLRDYSLDNKSQGRQSLNSHKHGPESDTDSMAEYGDGDTGKMTILTFSLQISHLFCLVCCWASP